MSKTKEIQYLGQMLTATVESDTDRINSIIQCLGKLMANDIEESIHIVPVKDGEFYKFFADKWLINLSNPKDSMLFCSLPLEFKAEEKSPYERDGEPAFVTTKQRVQDLVNALCNGLGFKPE